GGSGSGSDGGAGTTQLGLVLPAGSGPGTANQESVHSANEFGNSCRICRWHRSDMEIINCPCKCKGSVGYIHLKCLKRWIMHRRDNRCEICHAPYNITAERASLKQMIRAFCCGRCCGMIVKHVLFSASLMPLAHVILQQVLHCMDNLNQGSTEQLTVQEVFVASCALLTSSALFFHFFEFVTTRFLLIRNILRHWWMFGSTNDFGIVEVEDDSFDLF
ncbi:E3 ubiquitin-protein ligase MARCH7, partial [Drosophila navojoa]|uniref:E3 ubiquitin-protein ligase MARCH7 n=1 Tax=Drosophila navojoa TaxID=7232 RepID=UPI0011BEC05F